mgnify:CR=1 FL=1
MFNPKKYKAFDDAMATLDKWQRLGHEVTLLTNRPSKISFMKKSPLNQKSYFYAEKILISNFANSQTRFRAIVLFVI